MNILFECISSSNNQSFILKYEKDPAFGSGSSGIVINRFMYSSKDRDIYAEEYYKPLLELITNKFSFSDYNNDKIYVHGSYPAFIRCLKILIR